MRVVVLGCILLLSLVALAGCATPGDGDDDGLDDDQEDAGWMVEVHYLDRSDSYRARPDKGQADADGDGLLDVEEFLNGLDPNKADTDEDGLTDCQETSHANRSKCEARDFSCEEGEVCHTLTDPLWADSDRGPGRYVNTVFGHADADPTAPVPRGDGIPDGLEWYGYDVTLADGTVFREVRTSPHNLDHDNDGLEDGEELFYGSHPGIPDTDGDGCDDGSDPFPGHGQEKYRLGMQRFTMGEDGDADGRGDVVFILLVAGQASNLPASGAWAMQEGGERDLSGDDPPARPATGCTPPYLPWLAITILAIDEDGEQAAPLDIHSTSNPDAASRIHWNVRADRFAWSLDDPEEAWIEAPLTWSGPGGTLTFSPSVLLP